jgi:phage gp29-like protein
MSSAGGLSKQLAAARTEDPALRVPGMPPNLGEYAVPHVITYQAVLTTISKVYRQSDEALRDSWENARFMLNDPTVRECIEMRQRSVALLDWHLEPDDATDPRQKQLCEDLTKIIEQIPRFTQYRENLQQAIWYGRYACKHKMGWRWIRGKKRCCVVGWQPVHGDKLVFRYDDGSHEFDPDQIGIRIGAGFYQAWRTRGGTSDKLDKVSPTDHSMAYFLDDWERKLIAVHKHMIEDGEFEDPYSSGRIHGVGIRHRIYWAWYQKQELLAWLLEYLERSAFGLEIWTYPYGDKEAEARMRTAATERIGNNRNIILVPKPLGDEGTPYDVRVIEPGMAGADIVDRILREYYGWMIKRYILGQTMTTEAANTGMGSNLGSIHLDTYLQIIRYDAGNLEETLNTDLVKPLLEWNFPHMADIPVKFKIDTESPDVQGKLEAATAAWQMGTRIKESDVLELIGLDAPGEEDVALQNPEIAAAQMQMRGLAAQTAAAESNAAVQAQRAAVGVPTAADDAAVLDSLIGPGAATAAAVGALRAAPGAAADAAVLNEILGQHQDQIPGGLGDTAQPQEFDPEEVKKGLQMEKEHTKDPAIAMDIVLDHLREDPQYYAEEGAATPEGSERERVVESYAAESSWDRLGFLRLDGTDVFSRGEEGHDDLARRSGFQQTAHEAVQAGWVRYYLNNHSKGADGMNIEVLNHPKSLANASSFLSKYKHLRPFTIDIRQPDGSLASGRFDNHDEAQDFIQSGGKQKGHDPYTHQYAAGQEGTPGQPAPFTQGPSAGFESKSTKPLTQQTPAKKLGGVDWGDIDRYDDKVALIHKTHQKAIAPIKNTYEEAIVPAKTAYLNAVGLADTAHNEAHAPIRKSYDQAVALSRRAFNKTTASIRSAYKEGSISVEAYREAIAQAEKVKNEAETPAGNAYRAAMEPLHKAREEARALASGIYDRAVAPFKKTHDDAMASARKVHDEAIASVQRTYDDAMKPRRIEDYKSWAKEHDGPILGSDSVTAARTYNSMIYKTLNRGLRRGGPPSETVLLLDKAMNEASPLKRPILVHRGLARLPKVMKEGSEFTDKGFVSTTSDMAVALHFKRKAGFIVRIAIPAGHRVLAMGHATGNYDEEEILLPRGGRFRVSKVVQEGAEKRVDLEYLGQGESK